MGHILYYFWESFFVFHSTYLNMKWQNFRPRVQEKSVQCPHMSPYLDMRWEWFWVQNPSGKLFSGKLLWIWCLNVCKCAQNTYFWKFHENWTLHFLKNWHFGSKLSARGHFKIFARYFSFGSLKFTGVKINPSLTYSRNLSILSSVVFPQCSLEHSFGCHHWIVHKKSLLTPMHLNKSVAETFKWVLWTNYLW